MDGRHLSLPLFFSRSPLFLCLYAFHIKIKKVHLFWCKKVLKFSISGIFETFRENTLRKFMHEFHLFAPKINLSFSSVFPTKFLKSPPVSSAMESSERHYGAKRELTLVGGWELSEASLSKSLSRNLGEGGAGLVQLSGMYIHGEQRLRAQGNPVVENQCVRVCVCVGVVVVVILL